MIVNLTTDSERALRGVLWGYRGSWLTLRDVEALRADGSARPMVGEVVIHREHVAFLQVLP